jgi:hypothetical protein
MMKPSQTPRMRTSDNVPPRPQCCECRRNLHKFIHHVAIARCITVALDQPIDAAGWSYYGRVVSFRNVGGPEHANDCIQQYSVWFGEYGLDGDGLFCSTACAVPFARRFAKALYSQPTPLNVEHNAFWREQRERAAKSSTTGSGSRS